jgi:hypothetical protein
MATLDMRLMSLERRVAKHRKPYHFCCSCGWQPGTKAPHHHKQRLEELKQRPNKIGVKDVVS